MLSSTCVGDLLDLFGLHDFLFKQVAVQLGPEHAQRLLRQLELLPLKKSHAVTRLGSYSCRGAKPLYIRLQFAQETTHLRQTLLHEIAHFLDHQTRKKIEVYRNPHGSSWQRWLQLVGGEPGSGSSSAMKVLYRQRLKPVARCKRCGFLLERVRRLPQGRRWQHRSCGGLLVPLT